MQFAKKIFNRHKAPVPKVVKYTSEPPTLKKVFKQEESFNIRKKKWKHIKGDFACEWRKNCGTGEIREYHWGVLMRTDVKL